MQYHKARLSILIPILTLGKHGGFRVLYMLANHWKSQGHDVKLVSYFKNKKPYFSFYGDILWINDKGEIVLENDETFTLANSVPKRMVSIWRYLKRNSSKYDVVLANQNLSVWPVVFGSRAKNFYYIQAYEPEFYEQKTIRAFIQRSLSKITYYLPLVRIVNSNIYKNYKNLHTDSVILPGLDLTVYAPKKYEFKNNREFVIGCIGRNEEWKGSRDVTEAVKILHGKGINIKFKVAFNPVNYDRYEFVKPDGDENLADFYRSLDILIAPGHIQLGAVHYPVIEAMACKTPVITTGYYPADDENAYIVPIKSPEIIAEKILEVVRNYEKAMEKAEVAYRAISQFDWNIVSAKFIEIFYAKLEGDKYGKERKS